MRVTRASTRARTAASLAAVANQKNKRAARQKSKLNKEITAVDDGSQEAENAPSSAAVNLKKEEKESIDGFELEVNVDPSNNKRMKSNGKGGNKKRKIEVNSMIKGEPTTSSTINIKLEESSTTNLNEPIKMEVDEQELKIENHDVTVTINTEETSSTNNECIVTSIPPELFIQICKYLPPSALLRLARTCKLYYGWLCSKESTTTQQIWTNSRLEFVRSLRLPPPEGMDEIAYIRLVLERGCQICGAKLIHKVYWAFRVRICRKCYEAKTISEYRVHEDPRFINSKILYGLPYIQTTLWSRTRHRSFICRFYWLEDVERANEEFKSLSHSQQYEWMRQKMQYITAYMQDVEARESAVRNERHARSMERTNQLTSRREELDRRLQIMAQETDEENNPIYDIYRLRQCNSYKRACRVVNELSNRAWAMLYNKLVREYRGLG
ncbi:7211_t:CDS:2 [Ambispora leptoticha]|uniref:7211_t:CDS:1 n=1 Tax=Ambispora leptoticha TaxID=144679 RepID=A0A9N9BNU0_9GLOM|nr:7211_t:CDS:2 [Ambispora leptoticha]